MPKGWFSVNHSHVREGAAVQTNMVRRNGQPSALVTILKSGSASTLKVVSGVIDRMPSILAMLPPSPNSTSYSINHCFLVAVNCFRMNNRTIRQANGADDFCRQLVGQKATILREICWRTSTEFRCRLIEADPVG